MHVEERVAALLEVGNKRCERDFGAIGDVVEHRLRCEQAADGTPAAQFDFDALAGFSGGVFVG